jgi:hypothetical protein
MTDFRALCAELIAGLDGDCCPETQGNYYSSEAMNAITRARAALDEPEGEGPSDQELYDLWDKEAEYFALYGEAWRFAHAVLARWGRPALAPKPIPVSERLPNDGDCLVTSLGLRYCWWASKVYHSGQVRLTWQWKSMIEQQIEQHDFDWCFMYWLPASTQFLPTTVDSGQPA